jgi:hypothetical protein
VKKHSSAAIIEKLAKASRLAAQGISQNTICRQLGISVMTLHRWRARAAGSVDARLEQQRLLLENGRLRNVAANLLLEIRALEESSAQQPTRGEPAPPASRRLDLSSNGNNTDQDAQREQVLPTEA